MGGEGAGAVQCLGQLVVEHILDQRALAAAADAGHDGKRAERDLHVDVLEVVVTSAEDFNCGLRIADCGFLLWIGDRGLGIGTAINPKAKISYSTVQWLHRGKPHPPWTAL